MLPRIKVLKGHKIETSNKIERSKQNKFDICTNSAEVVKF